MNKFVDVTSIVQVIGCVFNSPSLLDLEDKYTIHDEDFPDQFHKIVFGAMYNLHSAKSKITIDAIVDYLAVRPKFEAIFKTNNGIEFLTKAAQLATLDTFNYYYSRLKKFTLLRAYDKCGLDVSDLYDPNNILDTTKKQKQEEWLDKTAIEDIADIVEQRIEKIRAQYVENSFNEGYQISEGIEEMLADLEKHPEVGAPLYGRLINTVTRGARIKKLYLRSAATGCGKALPNYEDIPTPNGWRKVGDIKIGDYLFSANGKPTKVLAVYPQPEEKEIWKVTFSDGTIAECCGQHLWGYYYNNNYLVEDTETIYNRILKSNSFDKFQIQTNQALQYPKKKFLITPYSMGTMIRDYIPKEYLEGSIGQRCNLLGGLLKDSDGFQFTTSSPQLKEDFIMLCRNLGYTTTCTENVIQFQRLLFKSIVKIEHTKAKTAMTCFTVDNKEHLFVAGKSLYVTHNTRALAADACNFACGEIYDTDFGMWIKNGAKLPTLFIATEQDRGEVQTLMLSFISAVNEEHILNNKYLDGEKERIQKAVEVLKEAPLWVEEIPDFSLQDIENCIKKYIREHEVTYIC